MTERDPRTADRETAEIVFDTWFRANVDFLEEAQSEWRENGINAIAAALAAERERIARWHDQQAAEIDRACDAAWVECVPDKGISDAKLHRKCAAAIRARCGHD